MPEYTQEQLDAIIADKIKEATRGLYTEDDLAKKVTSEVDRRVESGIQKGIETQRQKWESEFARKAQMTAEELAQKELSEKMSELNAREREILRKANLLDAKDALSKASVPKEQYEKLIDTLVLDDVDRTKENVSRFIDVFTATKADIEAKIKAELSTVQPPARGDGDKPVTKESFRTMGYSEKLKLKQENPELYKQMIAE